MEKFGNFVVGLLLGLVLVAILVILVLKGWSMYETESNRIAHQNDVPVVASVAEKPCFIVEAAPCCFVQKTRSHPKPKQKQSHRSVAAKVTPASKQMPIAIVVEKAIPTAIVAEKHLATAIVGKTHPSQGLLDGVN